MKEGIDYQIRVVGKNNVEVVLPKTMVGVGDKEFKTFNHDDLTLKENFGIDKVNKLLEELLKQKANWEDDKWVESFRQEQLDEVNKKIQMAQIAKNKVLETLEE
jgi:hypothetical protein